MSDPLDFAADLGGLPKLGGWVAPSDEDLQARQSITSIQSLRAAAGLPPNIPRNQIVEKDFVSPLGRRCINNQKSSNGCTGFSAAQASTRLRLLRGQPFQKLSGAAVYAQCNNNRDAGANIVRSAKVMETSGTCLESEMDFPNIYAAQIPPGTLRFKEDPNVLVTVTTFDDWLTALNMNMIPQGPVNATNAWVHNVGFDGNGVANLSNSSNSNHSVEGAGVVIIQGTPFIIMPNTWLWWGPFATQDPPWYPDFCERNSIVPLDVNPLAGCCLIGEGHINNCAQSDDGYAHGVSLNAPSDTDAPGAVA